MSQDAGMTVDLRPVVIRSARYGRIAYLSAATDRQIGATCVRRLLVLRV